MCCWGYVRQKERRGGALPRPRCIFCFADRGMLSFLGGGGMFRAGARVTFGRSPKSDQKVCLKPKVSRLPARTAQPRRQPGQIQIVANGHTASHQRGTGGHRAGTRSVRGPLAGRRAGRGHDRRPHGHRGRTPHPEQESGLPHYGTRRRRHLPPIKYRAAAARARERPPQATAQARPAVGGGDAGGLNSAARMGGATAGHRTKRNQMAAQGGTGRATTY